MSTETSGAMRVVPAVHGRQQVAAGPGLRDRARANRCAPPYDRRGLLELFARFAKATDMLDRVMRRAIWRRPRALRPRAAGRRGVGFKHLETFEIGDGVFIGAQAYIQGRFDGTCVHRQRVWIGPQTLLRRARPGARGVRRLGSGREGARLGAHRRASRRADSADRLGDPAGADRRLGRHRDERRHPAGRDGRGGRDRRRRRGGGATSRPSPLSPACRRFLRWRTDSELVRAEALRGGHIDAR